MPRMELLIKKVYTNIFAALSHSKFMTIKEIKKVAFNGNEFNKKIKSIKVKSKSNSKYFHLIIKMNQTPKNFLLSKFLLENAEFYVISFYLLKVLCKNLDKFFLKEKRCIWGSLVIFIIKMNFID